jgi:hypothetical protein
MTDSPRSSATRQQNDNWAHLALAGWASVLFWVCLFGCGGIYATVYLAPKWVLNSDLRKTERINHQRLLNWQTETARLQKLAVACERDPAFARELARHAFDFRPADEEAIALPPHLTLPVPTSTSSAPNPGIPQQGDSMTTADPWFLALLQWTIRHPKVSQSLLCLAGLITILAFTFLHGPAETAA